MRYRHNVKNDLEGKLTWRGRLRIINQPKKEFFTLKDVRDFFENEKRRYLSPS
jgi:hypothetical protein